MPAVRYKILHHGTYIQPIQNIQNTANTTNTANIPRLQPRTWPTVVVSAEISSRMVQTNTLLVVRCKISYQKYNKYSKYIRMLPETWLSFSHDCQCRALFKCGRNQHFVCGQVQNITPRNTTNTANTYECRQQHFPWLQQQVSLWSRYTINLHLHMVKIQPVHETCRKCEEEKNWAQLHTHPHLHTSATRCDK